MGKRTVEISCIGEPSGVDEMNVESSLVDLRQDGLREDDPIQ